MADFVALADRCIRDISARGKLPVLVGGTGLYMESLLSGVRFAEQKTDPAVRRQLEEQAAQLGADAMHEKLAQIDPEYAATVYPNNVGRVLRALELFQITGVTMTRQRAESKPSEPPYDSLLFCIGFEDRSVLYQRIDRRVDLMLEQGILREPGWSMIIVIPTIRLPRPSAIRNSFRISAEKARWSPVWTSSNRLPEIMQSGSSPGFAVCPRPFGWMEFRAIWRRRHLPIFTRTGRKWSLVCVNH